jgi:hypothetical protein
MNNITTKADGSHVAGYITFFNITITDFNGTLLNPEEITISIVDENLDETESGIPEKLQDGFYGYEWGIPANQTIGNYTAIGSYTIDGID